MMGEAPSFAVLQTAYLEALVQFIDYNEHDNLPACLLLDAKGERLKDAEGNPKILRHPRGAIQTVRGPNMMLLPSGSSDQSRKGQVRGTQTSPSQSHEIKTRNETQGGQLMFFRGHEGTQ